MTVSQDMQRSALEQFRRSGDSTTLLQTLSEGKERVNDLLLLQHALQTTDDPDLRDMIDAAAWAYANNLPLPRRPSEKDLDQIATGAIKAYGPLIAEVLPDLRELASAILTNTRTPPLLHAVIAAIGLHAQQKAEVFLVSKDSLGQETRFFSTHCDVCGGKEGDRGYIICRTCGRRVREGLLRERIMEQINRMPASERARVDVSATIENNLNVEHLNALPIQAVAEFLGHHPKAYGCTRCKNQPVRDCKCAQVVKIPSKCPDGWVVKGTYLVTGEPFYAVLRVRE